MPGSGARIIALEGAVNFRDLGGYPTSGGGRVRWGRLFRSGALHRLTAPDLAVLDRLGLRVVYDLRGGDERDRAPSVLPAGARSVLLPIGGDAARTQELAGLIVDGEPGEIPPDFLTRVYDAMAGAAAPTFGRLLTGLAEPGCLPALFHCTAGKDRTGMSAALLLSVLGVDDETILDDYELSAEHYTEQQMAKLRARPAEEGADAERYRPIFGAPRAAMASLLAGVRERHGSAETYLREQGGVAPEVFIRLRTLLVEPADRP